VQRRESNVCQIGVDSGSVVLYSPDGDRDGASLIVITLDLLNLFTKCDEVTA
jgi:hypothetical protein